MIYEVFFLFVFLEEFVKNCCYFVPFDKIGQ
jgi:hypothetical protein